MHFGEKISSLFKCNFSVLASWLYNVFVDLYNACTTYLFTQERDWNDGYLSIVQWLTARWQSATVHATGGGFPN